LFDMVAADKLMIAGAHLPFPGLLPKRQLATLTSRCLGASLCEEPGACPCIQSDTVRAERGQNPFGTPDTPPTCSGNRPNVGKPFNNSAD
jgi:hypothetical protein